ncbi:MAG TPA: LPS export ABC transporter periplasmic protein LptC [Desulfomonilia bacterium]|jgi:LPS export ABC transporter protein LptC
MRNKVLGGIALVAVILVITVILLFNHEGGKKRVAEKPMEADRVARNITLYELNTENDKTTVLHARKAFLKEDQVLDLFDITLNQEDKFKITGPEARYNMEKSRLNVKGDILLTAEDGSRAFFRDLTWEKSTNLINTKNPVRLEKEGGWLIGQRMEMTDDFSRISFSGGVHGQINRNFDIGS